MGWKDTNALRAAVDSSGHRPFLSGLSELPSSGARPDHRTVTALLSPWNGMQSSLARLIPLGGWSTARRRRVWVLRRLRRPLTAVGFRPVAYGPWTRARCTLWLLLCLRNLACNLTVVLLINLLHCGFRWGTRRLCLTCPYHGPTTDLWPRP